MKNVSRVMIVTDQAMVKLGFLQRVIEQLELRPNKVIYEVFLRRRTRSRHHNSKPWC